eukprot:1434515-Pyramimonas_sp.AAC.1
MLLLLCACGAPGGGKTQGSSWVCWAPRRGVTPDARALSQRHEILSGKRPDGTFATSAAAIYP